MGLMLGGIGIGLAFLFIVWFMISTTFERYLGADNYEDDNENQYKQEGFKAGVDYSMILVRELFKKNDLMVTNWDTLYIDMINQDKELTKNPDNYGKLLTEYREYVTNLGK